MFHAVRRVCSRRVKGDRFCRLTFEGERERTARGSAFDRDRLFLRRRSAVWTHGTDDAQNFSLQGMGRKCGGSRRMADSFKACEGMGPSGDGFVIRIASFANSAFGEQTHVVGVTGVRSLSVTS